MPEGNHGCFASLSMTAYRGPRLPLAARTPARRAPADCRRFQRQPIARTRSFIRPSLVNEPILRWIGKILSDRRQCDLADLSCRVPERGDLLRRKPPTEHTRID